VVANAAAGLGARHSLSGTALGIGIALVVLAFAARAGDEHL